MLVSHPLTCALWEPCEEYLGWGENPEYAGTPQPLPALSLRAAPSLHFESGASLQKAVAE